MLTLKQIYDNPEQVIAGLEKKHFTGAREAIAEVLSLDATRKAAQQKKDAAAAEMNKISKSIGMLMAQGKKDEANAAKAQTGSLKEQIALFDKEMAQAEEAQRLIGRLVSSRMTSLKMVVTGTSAGGIRYRLSKLAWYICPSLSGNCPVP